MAVIDPEARLAAFLKRIRKRALWTSCSPTCPESRAASAFRSPSCRRCMRAGFLLPGSMFALDVLGGTIQETGLGFDEGDANRSCLPIAGTLLPVPWRDQGRHRANPGVDEGGFLKRSDVDD